MFQRPHEFLSFSVFEPFLCVCLLFEPGKSAHIAAEGRPFLKLTEPGLRAAAEKWYRFFVKMNVSRRREHDFHKNKKYVFPAFGPPLGMILLLFTTKINKNAGQKSTVSGSPFWQNGRFA